MSATSPIHVIDREESAAALLKPIRRSILRALGQPTSAADVARKVGLPRQKVNYHLRELEKAGLVELVEERRKGNCIERIVAAKATSVLIDPTLLGELSQGQDPRDRFSFGYLVSAAARVIGDLVRIRRAADEAGARVPTLTLESEVRFATPAARKAYVEELSNCLAKLNSKYHDESAPEGRSFRFVLGGLPAITKDLESERADPEPNNPGASHE